MPAALSGPPRGSARRRPRRPFEGEGDLVDVAPVPVLARLERPHQRMSGRSEVRGRVLVLENFKRLRGYGWSGFRSLRTARQDKGHRGLVQAFLAAANHRGAVPIPVDELFEVSDVVLRANELLRDGSVSSYGD
jgi:hypothetical protein